MNWLIKFFRAPRQIGSVAPSSNSLGRLMARDINPDSRVLELGSGSGALTSHIIPKLIDHAQLTCVELDEELAQICQNKFPDIRIITADIQSILEQEASYDIIISGIPFAAMEPVRRQQIFRLIKQRLKPSGQFIMFQYSIYTRQELIEIFGNLKTTFTPWNIPPAFVFTCEKILPNT
jgi:phospholipid N-methyltransferase